MTRAGSRVQRGGRGQGRGRQKIEIRKMTKESNLQVTFSKRRMGVFNKACELCTLCAAEVAIIIFSPGNKVFSFGHPNVESVLDRYMTRTQRPHISGTIEFMKTSQTESIHDLNAKLVRINEELDNEKKRGKLAKMFLEQLGQPPVSKMSLEQLDNAQAVIDRVKLKLNRRSHELVSRNIVTDVSPHFIAESSRSDANVEPYQKRPMNDSNMVSEHQIEFGNNSCLVSDYDGLFNNNPIVTLDHIGLNDHSNVFVDGGFLNNSYFVANNGGYVVPCNPNNGGFVNNGGFITRPNQG